MSNVNKSKFYNSIEDHIISQKCLSCDTSYDQEEELDICPDEDCGGEDFELTTALEDESCTICGYHFDAYSSDAYQHSENGQHICSSCYDDLVDEENDGDSEEDDIVEEESSNQEPVLVEMPAVFKLDPPNYSNAPINSETSPTMEMPAIFRDMVTNNSAPQSSSESPATMEMPAILRDMATNNSASQSSSEPVETIEMPDVFKSMVAGGTSQGTAEPIPTMEMPAIFKEMAAQKVAGSSISVEDTETHPSEEVATYSPLRMIKHRDLVGKSIKRVYFAEWNGATVIETTDNCICVMYSSYNHFNGDQRCGELDTVEDYRRLILGR